MNNFTQQCFFGGVIPTKDFLFNDKLPLNAGIRVFPNNIATRKMSGVVITIPFRGDNHYAYMDNTNTGQRIYISPNKPYFFVGDIEVFKYVTFTPIGSWGAVDVLTLSIF
jgi:hypothetical protein